MGAPRRVEEPLVADLGHRRRVGSLLICVLGTVVLLAGAWWVTTSQIFQMRSLQVTGNVRLTSEEVAAQGGLGGHTNVLWFSASRVEHRLELDPWILSAHVARTLPSQITVRIQERIPVAIVSGSRLLVAADGVVLGPAPGSTRLPTIEATLGGTPQFQRVVGSPAGLVAAAGIPLPVRQRVTKIIVGKDGQITLTLTGGVEVLYGDASAPTAKGAALQAVLTWAKRNGIRAASIDLHAPDAPALSRNRNLLPSSALIP
jgi:cell division septal protein FtsQ